MVLKSGSRRGVGEKLKFRGGFLASARECDVDDLHPEKQGALIEVLRLTADPNPQSLVRRCRRSIAISPPYVVHITPAASRPDWHLLIED